jgi:hypothetical protein
MNGVGLILAGIMTLGVALYLSVRAPAGKSRPEGSNYFALAAMVLVAQATLFVVLSINSSENVTKPIAVFLWLAGMCIAAAIWMMRGKGDDGWGDNEDDDHPEPVPPSGYPAIQWDTFDQWREEWDCPSVLR